MSHSACFFTSSVRRRSSPSPKSAVAQAPSPAASSSWLATCASPRESGLSSASPEVGIGAAPGAGGIQHLARLLGRGRALEVILSSEDVNADLAERYGWINRAVPDVELDGFVGQLAQRIAGFPATALTAAKAAINALTLADPEVIRDDARLFQRLLRTDAAQQRTAQLLERGFQTRSEVELELGEALGELTTAN